MNPQIAVCRGEVVIHIDVRVQVNKQISIGLVLHQALKRTTLDASAQFHDVVLKHTCATVPEVVRLPHAIESFRQWVEVSGELITNTYRPTSCWRIDENSTEER